MFSKTNINCNINLKNPYALKFNEYPSIIVNVSKILNYQLNWSSEFKNNNPIWVECGCGNGELLSRLAVQNPNINYIGLDIRYKRIVKTADKISKLTLNNVKILKLYTEDLKELFFRKEEVDCYLIFFPDPWPKKKHAKHRYLNELFFQSIIPTLKTNGKIMIKTDNENYFNEIVGHMKNSGLINLEIELDLPLNDQTKFYQTPYEASYRKEGRTIYSVIWTKELIHNHLEIANTNKRSNKILSNPL